MMGWIDVGCWMFEDGWEKKCERVEGKMRNERAERKEGKVGRLGLGRLFLLDFWS